VKFSEGAKVLTPSRMRMSKLVAVREMPKASETLVGVPAVATARGSDKQGKKQPRCKKLRQGCNVVVGGTKGRRWRLPASLPNKRINSKPCLTVQVDVWLFDRKTPQLGELSAPSSSEEPRPLWHTPRRPSVGETFVG
jgi:hypothetical protein